MKHANTPFNAARRRLLTLLGLGAAGTALAAATGSKRLFAKQFVGEAAQGDLPKMVYDTELQMMVDSVTRIPICANMKKITVASDYPLVTARCDECPKNDGTGE